MIPGAPADEPDARAHLILERLDDPGDDGDAESGQAPEDGRLLDDHLRVDGADGHHLQRARRLTAGEQVTVADGRGNWRRFEVARAGHGVLELVAADRPRVEPRPAYEIVAAPALVSRNRFDSVVAQLTELGADAVVPLVAERCVARWDRADPDTVVARLRAVAREAAMQCRRARVPRVLPPMTPSQIASIDARIVVATREPQPADARDAARDDELAGARSRDRAVVVISGPEGGLSPRDLVAIGAHECLCLGAFVLRADTAPVAAAAVLTQRRNHCHGC